MYQRFFEYARERQLTKIRRESDPGSPPWTTDPVLQQYRFCNIYREDDRTTVWFRKNVRERVDAGDVLLATVLFRWFNRIRTGEAIWQQQVWGNFTPWELLLESGSEALGGVCHDAIRAYCGEHGPFTTGSYIIKTPDGMDKLVGVLRCVEWFMTREREIQFGSKMRLGHRQLSPLLLDMNAAENFEDPQPARLEQVWSWLREFPYLGDFMAYEIVTDLRHTPLLSCAPDVNTWANPGPGAMRGLNRIHGRDLKKSQPKHVWNCEMRDLLEASRDPENWPPRLGPPWEMREVEHTLCEFDKYERASRGEGRPRQVFRTSV